MANEAVFPAMDILEYFGHLVVEATAKALELQRFALDPD
jgi:hypothetical protein